jgi:hypothetical protein
LYPLQQDKNKIKSLYRIYSYQQMMEELEAINEACLRPVFPKHLCVHKIGGTKTPINTKTAHESPIFVLLYEVRFGSAMLEPLSRALSHIYEQLGYLRRSPRCITHLEHCNTKED